MPAVEVLIAVLVQTAALVPVIAAEHLIVAPAVEIAPVVVEIVADWMLAAVAVSCFQGC